MIRINGTRKIGRSGLRGFFIRLPQYYLETIAPSYIESELPKYLFVSIYDRKLKVETQAADYSTPMKVMVNESQVRLGLPARMVKKLGWKAKDSLVLSIDDDILILEKEE